MKTSSISRLKKACLKKCKLAQEQTYSFIKGKSKTYQNILGLREILMLSTAKRKIKLL